MNYYIKFNLLFVIFRFFKFPPLTNKYSIKPSSQIESLDPCSPEEVILTVQLPLSGKTLLGQSALAVAALDALDVPRPVQNFQQKPVDDRLLAAGTVEHRVPENIPKPVCGMDARKGLRSGPSSPPPPTQPFSPRVTSASTCAIRRNPTRPRESGESPQHPQHSLRGSTIHMWARGDALWETAAFLKEHHGLRT